jgi:hypothetical protein
VALKLRPQLEVLFSTLSSEIRLVTRSRPDLFAAIIILALLSGQMWFANVRKLWPLALISLVGMGLYLPMVENDRYVGGFVLVLFLTLLSSVRLQLRDLTAGRYVAVAVFCTMMLATADYNLRLLEHHFAIPGSGPNSTLEDIAVADRLSRMDLKPGDRVGVILNGTGAFWAHLAKLRIVAEIMDTDRGANEFWSSPAGVQQQVFDLFAGTHAKLIVAICPAAADVSGQWDPLIGSRYCIHRLD